MVLHSHTLRWRRECVACGQGRVKLHITPRTATSAARERRAIGSGLAASSARQTAYAILYRSGVPEGIRTPDLRFRKPLLYPAELPGHNPTSDPKLRAPSYRLGNGSGRLFARRRTKWT